MDFERLFGIELLDDDHFHSERAFNESMEVRNFILQDTLWKSFESNLGHMNDQQILDFSTCIVDDLDLETGTEGILDTLDAYWREQYGFLVKSQQLLKQWIISIDISLYERCSYSAVGKMHIRRFETITVNPMFIEVKNGIHKTYTSHSPRQ